MVPKSRSPSNAVTLSDKKDWMMGGFVDVDEEELVGVKDCLHDLEDSCRAKRRKVLESVSDAGDIQVKFMNGASGLFSSGAHLTTYPRVYELT